MPSASTTNAPASAARSDAGARLFVTVDSGRDEQISSRLTLEKLHERRGTCRVRAGWHSSGTVSRVVLDRSRQRPDQTQSLLAIQQDLRGGTEPQFPAGSLEQVLGHRRAVGIPR